MKISEAFKLYENNYILARNQSIRILESHRLVTRRLADFLCDKDISEMTVDDISAFRKHISPGRSLNTVRNDLVRIRSVLRYLRLCDIKCLKPELLIIPKRVDNLPTFLTSDEVAKMIDCAFNLRNKFVIALLYSSGIRLSEMISLNRGQIVDRQFSVIGKGGKARLCFIDARAEDLMEEYLEHRQDNCSALIVSENFKRRMTPTNVQLLIHNSAKRAGIEKVVTPHTLRHSFATNFLKNNGNMRYLSQMLGHASLETTARYAHVVDYDLQRQYQKFHTY